MSDPTPSLSRLRSSNRETRVAAIDAVAAAGAATPEELEALRGCLAAPEKLVQKRAAEAFAALHRKGIKVEPVLLPALASDDLRQRWGATFALAMIGPLPSQAMTTLTECLGLEDGDVRWAAAYLLMQTGQDGLPTRLVDLLRGGNPQQRKMAAYCLRRLGPRSIQIDEALNDALHDSSPVVRLAALAGVSALTTDSVASARRVVALLDDLDPGVRRAAAVALGELGAALPEVLAALDRATSGGDPSLRRAALRSLAKLQ